MANELRFIPVAEQPRILECPSCRETISTSARQCPFCTATIDPGIADKAADFMSKLNQACSDASYLRIAAGMMLSFLALLLLGSLGVPVVGLIGAIGMWFLLIAVSALAIRWRTRFGTLQSDDPDFQGAKRAMKVAMWIWIPFFTFFGIPIIVLFAGLISGFPH